MSQHPSKAITLVTIDCSNTDTERRPGRPDLRGHCQQPSLLGKNRRGDPGENHQRRTLTSRLVAPIAVTIDNIDTIDLSGIIIPGQPK
jgi:hypothetical protein